MKNYSKLIFSAFILLILVTPLVSANLPSAYKNNNDKIEMTLSKALTATGDGFKELFSGNLGGALAIMITGGTLHIVGIFLVVYALMVSILKISLLKDDEHKSMRNMFGIGVGLIAVATPSVFRLIANLLGGSFITILILLIVVFGIWIAVIKFRGHTYSAGSDLEQQRGGYLRSKAERIEKQRETNAINQEKKFDNALYSQEDKVIEEAEEDITEEIKEAESLHDQLIAINGMLGKMAKISDSESRSKFKNIILSQVSVFTHLLNEEMKQISQVENLSNALSKEINYGLGDYEKDYDFFNDLLKRETNTLKQNSNFVSSKHSKNIEAHIRKYEDELKGLFKQEIIDENKRRKLAIYVNDLEKKLVDYFSDLKKIEKDLLVHLNSTPINIAESVNLINSALVIDSQIVNILKQVDTYEIEQKELFRNEERNEERFIQIEKEIRAFDFN